MRKRLLSCVLATMSACFLCATPIMAQDDFPSGDDEYMVVQEAPKPGDVAIVPEKDLTQVPEDGLGSISITLEDTEEELDKSNVTFELIQIADVVKGSYEMQEPFDTAGIDINDIETANELTEAAKIFKDLVEEQELNIEAPQAVTNESGVALFDDVPVGVYLLYATDIAEYEVIDPFILSIPTWDETEEIMEYNVNVLPKHSHLPVVEVNKVDSQTGENIVSNQFAFTSFADESCKEAIQTVNADTSDGTAEFTLTYGTFYIKETQAPQGYGLSDEVVKVEFTEDGLYINDEFRNPDEEDGYLYSIYYNNTLLPSINTGINGNDWMLLAGGTLMLVAGITLIIHAKKEQA